MKNDHFPPQYEKIVRLLTPYQPYLVGGAVRDLLLDVPTHDLDFALPDGTGAAGRLIADQLGGGFYMLDEERGTTRVILGGQGEPRLSVDFTLFQGNSIEEDLAFRDFTITSMALEAGTDGKLIDPFQGKRDLAEGLIRATSDHSLTDDPLRCLRAVRLAAQLGFKILPETKAQIRRAHSQLADVSEERIRDELFRILEGPHQSAAVLSLAYLNLYQYVLPGELSDCSGRMLRNLENFWSLFTRPHDQDRAANWHQGLLVHRLGRYRQQIRTYLAQELVPGRNLLQLTFLMALIADPDPDIAGEAPGELLRQIPLGNDEMDFMIKGIKASKAFLTPPIGENSSQPLAVYRFYRSWGNASPAGIIMGLARESSRKEQDRDRWIACLDRARSLLDGYWERRQEWVDPPPILNGNDILNTFQLSPGPRIGELLEILREEQVRSGLSSRKEALNFLEEQITERDTSQ